MRLLYVANNYPDYIQKLYSSHSGLDCKPYLDQRAVLDAEAFGWNGAWASALSPLGYEFFEIDANVKPLQRAWMNERGANWPELTWTTAVPMLQAEAFQPDILLISTPRTHDVAWLQALRGKCPSLRLILGWSGSPCEEFDVLRHYDRVLSCSDFILEKYRKQGCRTAFLRHAFNRKVLDHLPLHVDIDNVVAFAGNIARGNGYHLERERLLEGIVENLPVDLYSPQVRLRPSSDFLDTALRITVYCAMRALRAVGIPQKIRRSIPLIGKAATWQSVPLFQVNRRLRPRMKEPVFGLNMYRTLQKAAVALNNHIDCAGPDAANQRLFEATGVGSCLLTDFKTNLHEMFELDRQVVAYSSLEECVEKGRWLLDHPRERAQIAAAGQARTLREHTFEHRAVELDALIRKLI